MLCYVNSDGLSRGPGSPPSCTVFDPIPIRALALEHSQYYTEHCLPQRGWRAGASSSCRDRCAGPPNQWKVDRQILAKEWSNIPGPRTCRRCFLFWRIKFKKITSKNHNYSRILWSPVISSRSKSKFLPWNIKHCFARYFVFIGFKYTLIIISEAILKHWPSLADMDDHSSGRDDWVEFSISYIFL